jgi:hypothetical protein
LEAVTRGLGKPEQTEETKCVLYWTAVCEIALALELIVVASCKNAINLVANPNTVYYYS